MGILTGLASGLKFVVYDSNNAYHSMCHSAGSHGMEYRGKNMELINLLVSADRQLEWFQGKDMETWLS